MPTDDDIVQRLLDWIDTTALMAAAQLGVADALAGGPLSPAAVAAAVGADEAATARLLRALTASGVVLAGGDGRFGLGPVGQRLRSDAESSLRPLLRTMGGKIGGSIFHLRDAVRSGSPAFDALYGTDPFAYLAAHPGEADVFNASMAALGAAFAGPVVEAYDFSGVSTLVDVGGGHGQVAIEIARRYPALAAVVFDSPSLVPGTRARIADAGLTARCRAVGGDFFTTVPVGDCHLLRWVVHDWDDARAGRILTTCRAASGDGGRLLVFEVVMPDTDGPHPAKSLDMMMLATLSGRERTAAEYESLLAVAGWRLARVLPSASPMSVLECWAA